ncbi:MAG: hypothetical protein CFK49_09500 [Armatimonadetes bacterium JP3_11]|jgi:uncharacterized protein (DUF3084 family)|nr:MAG: hypothetical protein CFK48_08460 [Armatimonadetes bacterium CP1_7O]OYT74226.1 MAG: hypothetical protein CFK49_09500 [Armatimonadetes bacterium JP3_11]RMH09982.1 MAG: DUF3084 domain-containing protein [Armatimonadota bacterium]
MTATMLVICVLLTLFGGVLAYTGDWLGRRLGKQRLSLFGIRPRHTATLITTVTGCLTVALTVMGMTLVNESFRAWITRGDRILLELRENEVRLKGLQARNAELQSVNQQLRSEQERLGNELKQLESEYQARLRQVQALEAQLAQAQRELRQNRDQLKSAQQQLAQARRIRQQLQQQIEAVRAQIAALQQQQEQLRRQNDEFAEQGAALASENAKLDSQNRQLQAQNLELAEQNQRLSRENEQLETQNSIMLERNAELRRQRDELERAARELAQLANIRLNPIAVQIGEELGRVIIPANWSEVRVRQALQDLLNLADKTARERGAASASGQSRAVFIPEKRVRLTSGEQVEITESESLEAIQQNIRASGDSVVVIAIALTNTAQGEPVPIELRLFRNRKVFEANEEIARVLVDCRPDRSPLGQVLTFLQTEVRERAIKAGVLPRQERAGSLPTVGETAPDTLLRLMEQARQCRTERVWLIARAAKTTYVGDTLTLKFEVLPDRPAGRG